MGSGSAAQTVQFEGYNIPPQPGIVIDDPRNPYSPAYDHRRQQHWHMQVLALFSKESEACCMC